MHRFSADELCERVRWDDLDEEALCPLLERARDEDLGGLGYRERPAAALDVTGSLVASRPTQLAIVAREACVVAGLPLLPRLLSLYDCQLSVEALRSDGQECAPGEALAVLSGDHRRILGCERVCLNFLQHLSGIATQTAHYVHLLSQSQTRLLDTRKTTPGYRSLEKYAVSCGGGWNHRRGLYDRIMLKDNHVVMHEDASKAIGSLVARARSIFPQLPIEVEVDDLVQLQAALEAQPDVVLLDNFNDTDLARAVALCRGICATEASGGITRERLPRLSDLGLDFVSTGALVHRARWVDLSLQPLGETTKS